jgi:hypothetical protein
MSQNSSISSEVFDAWRNRATKPRRPGPRLADLTVGVGGFTAAVDTGVSALGCLPLPNGYRFPTKGAAKRASERVLMALLKGRHCFIHGMPGTGKDAIVHAYSALTRKPCLMVTFRPGTDLAPWFYMRSYADGSGTGWKYGALWYALTEGIMGTDGKPRAPLILLSDVDRADSAQAEWFRILTDSISGRILGPDGKMHPIFPGTQFVCTANSCGTGDSRGRMTSANPIDASIMDRLGRAVEFTYLNWEDEVQVLREKFPRLVEAAPDVLVQLQGCCESLRKAISNEEIYGEFTHRGICEVLTECQDRVDLLGKVEKNLLSLGFKAWLDRLDADNRLAAKRLIDPYMKGGSIEEEA